jgi:predicted kinase
MKKVVLILCGPPGSGKTTFIKRFPDKRFFTILSRDEIREKMFGKEYKQNSNDEKKVTKCWDHLLGASIHLKHNIIIDKTNVDAAHLDGYVKQFPEADFILKIIFFNTPLWLCRVREVKRRILTGRHVPHGIIKDMKKRFDKINQNNYGKYFFYK